MNREAPEIVQFIKSKGVDLRQEGGMFVGDCPFCNGADKLWVTPVDQEWECKVCSPRWGNIYKFVRFWIEKRGQPA